MSRWFVAPLVLLFAACGPVRPPTPPTPPTPAPGPVCEAGQHHSCWHQPAGTWVYACPVYDSAGGVIGVQNETDPAKCPGKPQPPQPALIPDEELSAKPGDTVVKTWTKTASAIDRWRAAHPEKWRADGACLIDGAEGIDGAYAAISIELAKDGVVGQQSVTSGGKKSDCIFVNRVATNEYEETHAFEYGRACVATGPNAVKGVYIRSTGGEPPPVTPSPVTDCPAQPCPHRTYPDGKPHWKYKAKQHTMGNGDSTPVVEKDWEFCRSVGLGWMDEAETIPRGECPVRPDNHPERVPVENWLLEGGPTREGRNGQDCTPNHTDNPAAFLWGTGNCRMCNRPKTVCSDWR